MSAKKKLEENNTLNRDEVEEINEVYKLLDNKIQEMMGTHANPSIDF